MELEFCTTEELVDELTKRTTFAGIVIRSENEARGSEIAIHQNWDITYSNGFSNKQVAELLEDAVGHFHQLAEGEDE